MYKHCVYRGQVAVIICSENSVVVEKQFCIMICCVNITKHLHRDIRVTSVAFVEISVKVLIVDIPMFQSSSRKTYHFIFGTSTGNEDAPKTHSFYFKGRKCTWQQTCFQMSIKERMLLCCSLLATRQIISLKTTEVPWCAFNFIYDACLVNQK